VQVYTTIFLKTILHLPSSLVDSLSIFATISLFPLIIFSGWLSDKFGRRPVVLSGLISGALFILPAFYLLQKIGGNASHVDSLAIVMMASILVGLSAFLALVVGPQTALLAELFPAKARNSAATLPHNLAAGWIGGLLPLIVTWLNQRLGSDIAGLCYPTIFITVGALIAIKYLPETKTRILGE